MGGICRSVFVFHCFEATLRLVMATSDKPPRVKGGHFSKVTLSMFSYYVTQYPAHAKMVTSTKASVTETASLYSLRLSVMSDLVLGE